jgi:hypothetical protein
MKANALRLILSISFIFVGLFQVHSQINSVSEDLIRDRSDQKESTFLVSKGSIQIETGFFYENSENQNLSKNSQISYNLDAEYGEDSPEASCLYPLISSNTR